MYKLFSNTIGALAYLEESGIAHRDIKSDNIMIDQLGSEYKIIDFGEIK